MLEMKYRSGSALYGDDFTPEQIAKWYEEEREGYAEEVLSQDNTYAYAYHGLNKVYGFPFIGGKKDLKVLGLGSAYGDEFDPIIKQIQSIEIVDPSDEFAKAEHSKPVPVVYSKPAMDGGLNYADNSFDMITIFGVLHHIANVSHVIDECKRVLKPGGVILCREPTVSMGDWTKVRPGLTRNERGIPADIFRSIMKSRGFSVLLEQPFNFRPLVVVALKLGFKPFGSAFLARLDGCAARLFRWNYRYHSQGLLARFAPTSAYYVVRKPIN